MGIDRRHFLKAAAALGGGILGGRVFDIANAMEAERKHFDNSITRVLRIRSGDTVVIETGAHLLGGMVLGTRTEDWIRKYKDAMARRPNTHFTQITGPIHVEGADPGDILQIEILEIIPAPYGFGIKPEPSFIENGSLADDFKKDRVKWYRTDLKENDFGSLPEVRIPLRPFPGTLGVQHPEPGRNAGIPPGKHARSLGCKELVAGTVLYVPVWVKGAGVVTGNSNIAQGDGKDDAGASEGAFRNITLRMTVRKDLKKKVDWPFISTPTHWIALGTHADLPEARRMAVRKAERFLDAHYGIPDEEGCAFCSMAVDLHVTRMSGHTFGVHAMIPKSSFAGPRHTSKNSLLL